MPSTLHEMLLEMFRLRPALAAELLTGVLGVEVPAHLSARVEPTESTGLVPTEYRADALIVLTGADGPVLAVVIEVQLGRDRGKRWSWPVYVATLRARLRCPTELLVVCAARAVRVTAHPAGARTESHPGADRLRAGPPATRARGALGDGARW